NKVSAATLDSLLEQGTLRRLLRRQHSGNVTADSQRDPGQTSPLFFSRKRKSTVSRPFCNVIPPATATTKRYFAPAMACPGALQKVFDDAKREFENKLPPGTRFQDLLTVTTIDELYDALDKLQGQQRRL